MWRAGKDCPTCSTPDFPRGMQRVWIPARTRLLVAGRPVTLMTKTEFDRCKYRGSHYPVSKQEVNR